jgi:hypothetical protein
LISFSKLSLYQSAVLRGIGAMPPNARIAAVVREKTAGENEEAAPTADR